MSVAEWRNALALGASFGVCIGEMKALEFLTAKGVVSRDVSRKWVHRRSTVQYFCCLGLPGRYFRIKLILDNLNDQFTLIKLILAVGEPSKNVWLPQRLRASLLS
jgi:hypothetical protein